MIFEDDRVGILNVVNGEIDSFTPAIPLVPNDVVNFLESLGYKNKLDSNGWQWDYWIKFTHPNHQTLVLAGSGYYGGQTFSIEEQ